MATSHALLLTDVVDSTRLTEQLDERAAAALWAAHDRLARDLIPKWRGREVDRTDGMLLLFDSVSDAVGYALEYQRTLDERALGIEARAGIHCQRLTPPSVGEMPGSCTLAPARSRRAIASAAIRLAGSAVSRPAIRSHATIKRELDRLTLEFFQSVSFTPGSAPDYQHIHTLFVEQGLLIKNVGPTPEISTVSQFIHSLGRAGLKRRLARSVISAGGLHGECCATHLEERTHGVGSVACSWAA